MKIASIIKVLETLAPPSLQEQYDNAGLITGQAEWACSGVLCALDSTESIVEEAIQKKCNLIIAHHPIVFSGIKKLNGKNYVERTVIAAIKNDIAIYAIHTNLDNVITGVNGRMADKLELVNRKVLQAKDATLKKIFCFAPRQHADQVRQAIFDAGAGHIGNYAECSFGTEGIGTFKAGEGANPFIGNIGQLHREPETKIEVVFPSYLESAVVDAMLRAHPYEEVAYDIVSVDNRHGAIGSGLVGDLPAALGERDLMEILKNRFGLRVVRHSAFLNRPVRRLAICGGAGSFLISRALMAGADAFITADLKYHEFFDADGKLLLCDIGHFESEQFTIGLLVEHLLEKFPTFAVLKSEINTNPVNYYF
jgi:dinuclear metal center YbgI/SA1388 family protein